MLAARPQRGGGGGAHLDDLRQRRGQLGKGKTEPVDALAIARITAREQRLPPVRLTVGSAADLRALLDYREDLVQERGALVNRAHAELGGLRVGYQQFIPTLTTRARSRPRSSCSRRTTASAPSCAAPPETRHRYRYRDSGTETTDRRAGRRRQHHVDRPVWRRAAGRGPVIAEVVDIRRYPNRNAFAAANGSAPLPASSGRTVRHRFNPGGNGQLNRALYTIALTQIRGDTEGRVYYERKRAAGKTKREALRCLKRRFPTSCSPPCVTTPTGTPTVPLLGPPVSSAGLADFDKSGCGRRKRGTTNCLRQAAWQGFQPQPCSSLRRSTTPTTQQRTPPHQPGGTYSEI